MTGSIMCSTPRCNYQPQDPFTYMPKAPHHRVGEGVDGPPTSKNLISKRIPLDDLEDDHPIFFPKLLFPSPPRSNNNNSISISISSSRSRRSRITPRTTFSNNKNNTTSTTQQELSPSLKYQSSLIRLLDGKSLQQLKDKRDRVVTETETGSAVVVSGCNDDDDALVGTIITVSNNNNNNNNTMEENLRKTNNDADVEEEEEEEEGNLSNSFDHQAMLLSSAPTMPLFLSTPVKEGKLSMKTQQRNGGVVAMGTVKGLQRQDSGIARCA